MKIRSPLLSSHSPAMHLNCQPERREGKRKEIWLSETTFWRFLFFSLSPLPTGLFFLVRITPNRSPLPLTSKGVYVWFLKFCNPPPCSILLKWSCVILKELLEIMEYHLKIPGDTRCGKLLKTRSLRMYTLYITHTYYTYFRIHADWSKNPVGFPWCLFRFLLPPLKIDCPHLIKEPFPSPHPLPLPHPTPICVPHFKISFNLSFSFFSFSFAQKMWENAKVKTRAPFFSGWFTCARNTGTRICIVTFCTIFLQPFLIPKKSYL